MYDKSDPRASLVHSGPGEIRAATEFAAAEYGRFYDEAPQESDANGRSWYFRGQNLVLHYWEAAPGGLRVRQGQVDEYALYLPDDNVTVEISAGGVTETITGESVTFIPPGDSKIRVSEGGRVFRLVTTLNDDVAAKCSNAASYALPHPNIPPFQSWPEPRGGYRIRSYPMVPAKEGQFGRIFRCSTFMINVIKPHVGLRDATKMSPHAHDDFEQCSLAVDGGYFHYIRWPWTTNLNAWRADDKEYCGAPSVAIIPPPAIHTTRAVGTGANRLVDIFCPPRVDFSQMAGWVLNAEDYPMPGDD